MGSRGRASEDGSSGRRIGHGFVAVPLLVSGLRVVRLGLIGLRA